jgi:hypothetical protein
MLVRAMEHAVPDGALRLGRLLSAFRSTFPGPTYASKPHTMSRSCSREKTRRGLRIGVTSRLQTSRAARAFYLDFPSIESWERIVALP